MANNIQTLIDRARRVTMTDKEREEQRRSFAYGNTQIENPRISRDLIDRAAQEMASHNMKQAVVRIRLEVERGTGAEQVRPLVEAIGEAVLSVNPTGGYEISLCTAEIKEVAVTSLKGGRTP